MSTLTDTQRKLLDWLASHRGAIWIGASWQGVADVLVRDGYVFAAGSGMYGATEEGRRVLCPRV